MFGLLWSRPFLEVEIDIGYSVPAGVVIIFTSIITEVSCAFSLRASIDIMHSHVSKLLTSDQIGTGSGITYKRIPWFESITITHLSMKAMPVRG